LEIIASHSCWIAAGCVKQGDKDREIDQKNTDQEQRNEQPEEPCAYEHTFMEAHLRFPRLFPLGYGRLLGCLPWCLIKVHPGPFLFLLRQLFLVSIVPCFTQSPRALDAYMYERTDKA